MRPLGLGIAAISAVKEQFVEARVFVVVTLNPLFVTGNLSTKYAQNPVVPKTRERKAIDQAGSELESGEQIAFEIQINMHP
jgi:hypothetical protein